MNIVDLIIILFILLGGLFGFKEGVFKKLMSTIGLILVIVIAFNLKNKLSIYFYENLPFLDLWGVFKGIQILNVIFYEVLAFVVIASALMLVYRTLLMMTGLLEKIIKATVILTLPSKILGFIIGLIEHYVWAYIILFVLTLPFANVKDIYTSKCASFIMERTPYLSKFTNKTVDVYNDIYKLIEERETKTNKELNEETMDLMLKYKMITVESAEDLLNRNKVSVNSGAFIEKYRNDNYNGEVSNQETDENNAAVENTENNNDNIEDNMDKIDIYTGPDEITESDE